MRLTHWKKLGAASASQTIYHLAEIGSTVSLCGKDISGYREYSTIHKGRICQYCSTNLRIVQKPPPEASGDIRVIVTATKAEVNELLQQLYVLLDRHTSVATMNTYERFFAGVVGDMEAEILTRRDKDLGRRYGSRKSARKDRIGDDRRDESMPQNNEESG